MPLKPYRKPELRKIKLRGFVPKTDAERKILDAALLMKEIDFWEKLIGGKIAPRDPKQKSWHLLTPIEKRNYKNQLEILRKQLEEMGAGK